MVSRSCIIHLTEFNEIMAVTMTPKEHELMMLMFARMQESIGVLTDVLKSREIMTGDDEKAFNHATHSDPKRLLRFVLQAHDDYQKCAEQVGVVTGLENGPPSVPTP